MPFGIPFEVDRVKREIEKSLELFGKLYTKAYANAAILTSSSPPSPSPSPSSSSAYLIRRPQALAPECAGTLKIEGRTHYCWVKQNYTLAFGTTTSTATATATATVVEKGTINLWNYRLQGTQERPDGPRKGGPDWVPDELSPTCTLCKRQFSLLVFHHHCRACGLVFCADCAGNRVDMPQYGYKKPQRVCNSCFVKDKTRRKSVMVKVEEKVEANADYHGIQLLHAQRQPYALECESLEEKLKWMSVLKTCCMRSPPPAHGSAAEARAFRLAYRQMAWMAGKYDPYYASGTMEEMVTDVIAARVKREVIEPAVANADGVSDKMKIRATISMYKEAQSMLRAVVPASLAKTRRDADAAASTSAVATLEEVRAAEAAAAEHIRASVEPAMAAIVDEVCAPMVKRVAGVLSGVLTEVFAQLFGQLDAGMVAAPSIVDASSCHAYLDTLSQRIMSRHESFAGLTTSIDTLATALLEARQADDACLVAFSVNTVVERVFNSIQCLADAVVFTLSEDDLLFSAATGGGPTTATLLAAWHHRVYPCLLNESKREYTSIVRDTVRDALLPVLSDRVLGDAHTSAALHTASDNVPASCERYVSTSSLLDDLLFAFAQRTVDETIASTIDGGTMSIDACTLSQEVTRLSI